MTKKTLPLPKEVIGPCVPNPRPMSILSPGEVYSVTEPEYIGAMGIRIELFSEPQRHPCAKPTPSYSFTEPDRNGEFEVTRHPPEWPEEPTEIELREKIEDLIGMLLFLRADEVAMARLHEIERVIVDDVLKENRHLRCPGCANWLTALVKKARGEDWKRTK